MATYVLPIASGLYFPIGAFFSLSILEPETVHEFFINEDAGRREIKVENEFHTSIVLQ
jgi:hypothetical protein